MPEQNTTPSRDSLIYDWNTSEEQPAFPAGSIAFDDESLRDGLQSPSVTDPTIVTKIRILHLMEALGIQSADVGLPAAGPRTYDDTLALVNEIKGSKMRLRPNAAARTMVPDIEPIVDISQKTGVPVEVAMFVGSSPIRFYTEGWSISKLLRLTEEAVGFAVKHELPVMFVTEDTTRATPDTIKALYQTAIRSGAGRITVADTVGHVTPPGVRSIVKYVRKIADEAGSHVLLDWHGHNDRGLGVVNAVTAALSGCNQVHGTALGIGERCGNTAMDQLLVNLKLMGLIDNDLSVLAEYTRTVSEAVGIDVPCNYPVFGSDAFRTATGVHAAAVVKAANRGDTWLSDMVYSAVPASLFGLEQIIEVGPMSGIKNVVYWLSKRSIDPDPELVDAIFKAAKESKSLLSEDQIMGIVGRFTAD